MAHISLHTLYMSILTASKFNEIFDALEHIGQFCQGDYTIFCQRQPVCAVRLAFQVLIDSFWPPSCNQVRECGQLDKSSLDT